MDKPNHNLDHETWLDVIDRCWNWFEDGLGFVEAKHLLRVALGLSAETTEALHRPLVQLHFLVAKSNPVRFSYRMWREARDEPGTPWQYRIAAQIEIDELLDLPWRAQQHEGREDPFVREALELYAAALADSTCPARQRERAARQLALLLGRAAPRKSADRPRRHGPQTVEYRNDVRCETIPAKAPPPAPAAEEVAPVPGPAAFTPPVAPCAAAPPAAKALPQELLSPPTRDRLRRLAFWEPPALNPRGSLGNDLSWRLPRRARAVRQVLTPQRLKCAPPRRNIPTRQATAPRAPVFLDPDEDLRPRARPPPVDASKPTPSRPAGLPRGGALRCAP